PLSRDDSPAQPRLFPGEVASGEELPAVAQALEGVGPAVLQGDAGARHQVLDGAGHQDLTGAGGGHDPGGKVDRDPAHVLTAEVDLAGVEPRPDLDPAVSQLLTEGQGAADGT